VILKAAFAVSGSTLQFLLLFGFMGACICSLLRPILYGWALLHLSIIAAAQTLGNCTAAVVLQGPGMLRSWAVTSSKVSLRLALAGMQLAGEAGRKLAEKLSAWNMTRQLAQWDQRTARRPQQHFRVSQRKAGASAQGMPCTSELSRSVSSRAKLAAQPSELKSAVRKGSRKFQRNARKSGSSATTAAPLEGAEWPGTRACAEASAAKREGLAANQQRTRSSRIRDALAVDCAQSRPACRLVECHEVAAGQRAGSISPAQPESAAAANPCAGLLVFSGELTVFCSRVNA
jgi:hypothetical protein